MDPQRKILLLILDGIGVAPKSNGNAVVLAEPSNLARMWDAYPRTYLEASGENVGLVKNTSGNSEVGHLTIGSGRTHYQNLFKINNSIKKGQFFFNTTLQNLLKHSVESKGKIHLMGCLSDGSVHSHIDHFIAVLDFLAHEKFEGEVLIHAFTDGRDTPQQIASKFFEKIEQHMENLGIGKIASICGRAYAMDRNDIFERTEKAYQLILAGEGEMFKTWEEAIKSNYDKGRTDEYIEPCNILEKNAIKDNDAILFMNFRPDRAIQLAKKLKDSPINNLFFAGMVEYERGFPSQVIFPKEYLSLPLGRVFSELGIKQLRIAESEKFPHVTYFFNGGQPIQYPGEERIKILSPRVPTYDLKPEMSAYEVFDALDQAIKSKETYRFITVNIANGDMVGHTGNLDAGVQAMRIVNDIVGKIAKLAKNFGWTLIITADHGNLERMIDPQTNLPNTEHTQNPVPFLIVDDKLNNNFPNKQLRSGSLSDVAPTILRLMKISTPATMSGRSLI